MIDSAPYPPKGIGRFSLRSVSTFSSYLTEFALDFALVAESSARKSEGMLWTNPENLL